MECKLLQPLSRLGRQRPSQQSCVRVQRLYVLCIFLAQYPLTKLTDEMGSFDPSLAAFTPIEYLGTKAGSDLCTVGFDQLAFIAGTSSNIFSALNYTVPLIT